MISRQVGRRINTASAYKKAAGIRQRGGTRRAAGGKREAMSPKETWKLVQLVACGSIFVLLVAVKLLLPGKVAQLNSRLSDMMARNIDVQAVFSAVGRAVSERRTPLWRMSIRLCFSLKRQRMELWRQRPRQAVRPRPLSA